MTLSMYQASIPLLVRMLKNLSVILDKTALYAETKKIDPSVFINSRLAPDMFALNRQVQIATDTAKGCAARLAGIEIPSYADTETTFTELKARITKTLDFLESVNAAQINGSEERSISMTIGGKEIKLNGQQYLLGFVLPNFYFHINMTYAILRHNGIDIGKKDYLGTA